MSAPAIDWNEATEEATTILRDYLRIDTTNPPGGEEAGCILLRDILAADGIDSTLHDAGGGRVSISARLAGRGGSSVKPIVLLSHVDVVPVEQARWKHDAFGGELIEGTVWGRGALDMKGMGVMELMTVLLAKRHKIELDRDIVFLAVADEEEGGTHGVHHIAKTAPELLDAAFVLNEGAYGLCEFMGRESKIFGLGPSEKSPCWLRVRAKGEPGHASVPHSRNALVKLVRALARIEALQHEARVTPAVEAMLRTLAAKGFVPEDLDPNDAGTLEMLGHANAHLRAITHDTVSVTSMHSGSKINIIPDAAEATLDCRLLPDTDPEAFVARLKEACDDPSIEFEHVMGHVSGASSMDTPLVAAVHEVIAERFGDEAFVMPLMSPGFTDSHAFRAAGGQAYGFTPSLLTGEELSTIHGHNERISVENLRLGCEVLFDVVRRVAAHGG